MKTIHKYSTPVKDTVVLRLPVGAVLLEVGSQEPGRLSFWFAVNTEEHLEHRSFEVRGTGHPLGDVGAHVGTVHAAPFVWHVFEEAR